MPVFKSCAVLLSGNKEVYRKGEEVSGVVVLDVNEEVVVKGVQIYLFGESLTKWDSSNSGDNVAKEKYFRQIATATGLKQNANGRNFILPAGRFECGFKFLFNPEGESPSSYEGEYGGIRYWIKAEVERPFPHFDKAAHRAITVVDNIDVNETKYKAPVKSQSQKQVSKALGFGDAGTLTLTSSTDRGAYCAGEKIALAVVATNETNRDLGRLKAQLVQRVNFTANNNTRLKETVLRVLEGMLVGKGEERVWKDQLLEVDAIPPSTKPRSCHIIEVSYYVKVFVEVPLGFNLENILPITIGTIPYGYTSPASQGATAASLEVDLSTAITYTKCSRGFQICKKSDGDFNNLNYNYVPMCVYVPNYVFPPQQLPTAAETKAAAAQVPFTAAVLPTELPPSYDDAITMGNADANKEVSVEQEKADKPYGMLLLRFPDNDIQEFRSTILKESKSLAACGGEIIACTPQPLFPPDLWPERTSVAILKFASVESATAWLTKTPWVTAPSWLGSCDAMVGTMIEQFRKTNRVFTMVKAKLKTDVTEGKALEVQHSYEKTVRPLRLMKTGVSLVDGKQYTTLRGRWLDEGQYLSVYQWESLDKFYEYKLEKQQGKYKEANDLMLGIYDFKPAVVFQSEDLSPFRVSCVQ